MTLYTYRCVKCGMESQVNLRADRVQHMPCCDSTGQRVWGFSAATVMHEHMNQSLGKPVSSMRQFKDGLKAQSEAMTARTGIETNLQPVDISDRKALGVTDDGIG